MATVIENITDSIRKETFCIEVREREDSYKERKKKKIFLKISSPLWLASFFLVLGYSPSTTFLWVLLIFLGLFFSYMFLVYLKFFDRDIYWIEKDPIEYSEKFSMLFMPTRFFEIVKDITINGTVKRIAPSKEGEDKIPPRILDILCFDCHRSHETLYSYIEKGEGEVIFAIGDDRAYLDSRYNHGYCLDDPALKGIDHDVLTKKFTATIEGRELPLGSNGYGIYILPEEGLNTGELLRNSKK